MLTMKRYTLKPWQLTLSFISVISLSLVIYLYIAKPSLDMTLVFVVSLFCLANVAVLSVSLFQLLSITPRVRHLTNCVRRWSNGDLNTRNRIGDYGELSDLEVELNHMFSRLQEISAKEQHNQQTILGKNHLLTAILDSAAAAIYGVDENGRCIFANPQCVKLLGYRSEEQLIACNMRSLIHQNPDDVNAIVSSIIEQENKRDENLKEDHFWRADGSSFPVEYWSHPMMLNDNKMGAVISFHDNSERLESEALIRHQAHYDALTDLPNRFLALRRLEQLVDASERSGKMLAVIFLDLDDFKKINDSLGHEAGDQLLITAADRLMKATRKEDTVGRLGGDEFIILLDGLSSANDAQPLAENLIGGFRKPFYIDNRQLILTASIGIAIYPNDGKTPSELLRNADSAMYHTKSIGRNTYSYFTHAMNKEVSRRLAIEEQIHGALERGELQVHYQIQLDIRDGSIMGAEALLRWNNPVLGNVSPAEFIPIAEQTGVIEPMGEFILHRALETAHTWQQTFNDDFRIAINLSPRQFRNPNLVQLINDSVCQLGMQPKDLELEITEGVLLSGHAYTLDALMALSEAGFCISMDDFGTGYSSLSYLRTYPFQILKIDRSFIKDMNTDDTSKELIIATIEMAHALGIRVIAEGVETQEQFDELSFMMCDYAQGFLISKPVVLDELLKIGEHYIKSIQANEEPCLKNAERVAEDKPIKTYG
ncbi:putative bifunctional diguanylate cyclase/phosphodiesterase [Shewanella kaireitica]|uniref:putative bifunctional diguanylate cyclase/phosphodiesterase n=1 Tax=Shewanella kaireitica TaxID=212021 RepID=UPI00200CC6D4|nr:EAL domain-containing protein [Shewanella kaireitica]MCL1093962.1 EAL domain-containing protein [Shewanella kaireitica]